MQQEPGKSFLQRRLGGRYAITMTVVYGASFLLLSLDRLAPAGDRMLTSGVPDLLLGAALFAIVTTIPQFLRAAAAPAGTTPATVNAGQAERTSDDLK